jgi:hypothetical protein
MLYYSSAKVLYFTGGNSSDFFFMSGFILSKTCVEVLSVSLNVLPEARSAILPQNIAYVRYIWHHSVQNLLSSRLLSRNLKIRIYKTIILPLAKLGL